MYVCMLNQESTEYVLSTFYILTSSNRSTDTRVIYANTMYLDSFIPRTTDNSGVIKLYA